MQLRLVVGGIALLAAGTACGAPGETRVSGAETPATSVAIARPAFVLAGTDGKPFDFGARTSGKVTFLAFGYINCPDVCPVHMANLATVLGKLSPSERMNTMVVFVSIDPDRDSLPALKKWLGAVDASFVGLTGSRAALDSAQQAVGLAPAVISAGAAGKAAVVNHAAPVIVFTADDSAHVMYTFGTRQADWERDMPRLLAKKRAAGSGR